jgi:hypothetical protein
MGCAGWISFNKTSNDGGKIVWRGHSCPRRVGGTPTRQTAVAEPRQGGSARRRAHPSPGTPPSLARLGGSVTFNRRQTLSF